MLLLSSILLATTPVQPPVESSAPAMLAPGAPIATAVAPAAGDDAGFSYTFVEVGVSTLDNDNLQDDIDAWGGRASLGLSKFVLFLDYASEDGKIIDNDSIGLGAGLNFDLSPKFDLVTEAAVIFDDASGTIDEGSSTGWTLRVGGRWMVLPTSNGGLELTGGYRWIDREALFSNQEIGAWDLGGRFHFLSALSVGANYEFLEDDSRWGLNARFSF